VTRCDKVLAPLWLLVAFVGFLPALNRVLHPDDYAERWSLIGRFDPLRGKEWKLSLSPVPPVVANQINLGFWSFALLSGVLYAVLHYS
jgi:hypothetical protein